MRITRGGPGAIATLNNRGGLPPNRYALASDGVDDVITLANESTFGFERTDAFSVELWIRTTDATGFVIVKGVRESTTYHGWYFGMQIEGGNDGVTQFGLINNYGTGDRLAVGATNAVHDGTWHHVAVTYDGSSLASGVTLYVDAVAETPIVATDNLSASVLTSDPVTIGARLAPASFAGVAGDMDEIRIWDVERTAVQIAASYKTRIDSAPGLVGAWNCEKLEVITSGAIITNVGQAIGATPSHRLADTSGGASHGTFTNFPNDPWVTVGSLPW